MITHMDKSRRDFIRVDEIKVKCNIQIGQIQSLSIQESMGSHTVVEVEAGIEAGSLQLVGNQFNSQPLAIDAIKDGRKIQLFSGVISEIRIDKEAVYDIIHISAYSLSFFMDLEKKCKSYQGDSSVLELIRKVAKEHSFSVLCSAQDKMTEVPFIQYQETDWEFIMRLSTHLHALACVANDYVGKGIYLGNKKHGEPLKLIALNEKWCMNTEYMKRMGFDAKRAIYYEVVTNQVFHLGQNVYYNNEILWPYRIKMFLKQGVLYCTYWLAGELYHVTPACYNPCIKGASLEGTVLERQNEAVKVHLDIDEEQDVNRAHYYPWFPEYGNMVYCMPEKGSKIRLLTVGEDERDAIGIHCVRQNGGACRETQIPSNRWFSTDENKKMTLQPSIIELSGDGGQSKISFQDSTGNSIKSSKEIIIQANGQVTLQGTKVNLNASGEITAIKRELGDPAVVNICYNLDAMGKKTMFSNLEELRIRNISRGGGSHKEQQALLGMSGTGKEEQKKKLQFELQKLLEQEDQKSSYELGICVLNIISAIPQCVDQDKLSRIAMGFRPVIGCMKGD